MSEHLKLSNQICHRFYVASNAIIRAYRPLLQELDVTYPQYIVLLALWEQDGVEVGKVQSMTKIDAGALSLILKKLEAKNYITLTPSEHDKRVKCILLTDSGRELYQRAQDIPKQLMCKVSHISADEVQQLKVIVDKLIMDVCDTDSI